MNVPMNAPSQFKDLNEFLAKHSAKNEQKGGRGVVLYPYSDPR